MGECDVALEIRADDLGCLKSPDAQFPIDRERSKQGIQMGILCDEFLLDQQGVCLCSGLQVKPFTPGGFIKDGSPVSRTTRQHQWKPLQAAEFNSIRVRQGKTWA